MFKNLETGVVIKLINDLTTFCNLENLTKDCSSIRIYNKPSLITLYTHSSFRWYWKARFCNRHNNLYVTTIRNLNVFIYRFSLVEYTFSPKLNGKLYGQ